MLVGEGDDAELRDLQLGQVVRLGSVAAVVVGLLDGTRDAEGLLVGAAEILGEELNPLGLVELLQALDRRALLDTPRARMMVAQGLVRADLAALQRLARREKQIAPYDGQAADADVVMGPGPGWTCHACARCCTEQHLMSPVTREERDAILLGFAQKAHNRGADPSNFVPLPSESGDPMYLLRQRDGACAYLDRDRRCLIEKELGTEAKPSGCRLFPFRGVRTPSGWSVGMSLACPTVACGADEDPRPVAKQTIGRLAVLRPKLLREVPAEVRITEDDTISWTEYERWERRALALLGDTSVHPVDAWLEALDDFTRVCQDVAHEISLDDHDVLELTHEAEIPSEAEIHFLPSPRQAADKLLTDLSIWSELLLGLEAADPMAVRRLRSGLNRLRISAGESPDAPQVLSEGVRLEKRKRRVAGKSSPTLEDLPVDDVFQTDQMPRMAAADLRPGDPDLQRRYLIQALAGKRPFEFGTISRGLVSLSLFTGLLGLEDVAGDELQLQWRDVAYLSTHAQLTDVLDTRASVRATRIERPMHEALLGR